MARTLLLLGFCSLALAQTPPGASAGPAQVNSGVDWRFAHPDAGMRASLNFQSLLNSPAIKNAIEQGKSQAKDNAAQIELALAMLRTVDRVSLSVRQKAGAKTAAGVSLNPDVLVQVTGSFDSQVIAGLFPSTGTGKVKVVGPHTLLIGDGDSFALAAERMATGAAIPAGEMEQSDIWLSASYAFLAQAAASPGNAANPLPPPLQGLRDISVGINLGEAPEINMLLTAADEAGAGEMLKTFQAATEQAALAAPTAAAAAKALTMRQDGSRIRVHFVVPPELVTLAQQQVASGGLPAQLAPLLGSFGLGGYSPAASAKRPASVIVPVPPPQNGGKIRIYGLDNGPTEIPAK